MSTQPSRVKVWCDGCYDLVHFGHANSLRQAKLLGDHLVVGVHSDADITRHKGPPVYTFDERCKLISAIRWVDQVVEGSPYVTSLKTLDQYECDFCCHGDDITLTADGSDTYKEIKLEGRYREVQRTPGISTTGLVARILGKASRSPWTGSSFQLSTRKIVEFSGGEARKVGDKVVYVCGGFDLFHVGHVQFLEKVAELGDYVIVGLYSDEVVRGYKGADYPVMRMHERLLGVLACKYVSEVVIDAPFHVTEDLVNNFLIDVVVSGSLGTGEEGVEDPFKYPKQVGIFLQVNSESDVTTETIIERIRRNKFQYEERNERKEQKEIDLINDKHS
ncbi:ethanolamine-phosphate cytidylyltransferase [Tribolium castaneum]|uniref:ethanolamine-phosphate cytidylyltransferase n=1 Tax=Tribolium castaneum TaxID=7070 RepID=D6WEF7_TRICA|nr:PREDICTED: ethanolamine-phosphate cytidylyltransferase [Tribolium castaneum]EFA00402.1 Ethanolamine-phosphate cytidylyltransferase-like Protein [Tribolium castaneum]|eukprot:XP_972618.1 PREDICTED: ethanolamine-phosphate cytidylyltransferase [Tribolium castaneum]